MLCDFCADALSWHCTREVSKGTLHFLAGAVTASGPPACRSVRRACFRSRMALFLTRRASNWSAMFFSRACRTRRVSTADARACGARGAHLLGLGLVDVLHQNALVLEDVALHLHGVATRVRPGGRKHAQRTARFRTALAPRRARGAAQRRCRAAQRKGGAPSGTSRGTCACQSSWSRGTCAPARERAAEAAAGAQQRERRPGHRAARVSAGARTC